MPLITTPAFLLRPCFAALPCGPLFLPVSTELLVLIAFPPVAWELYWDLEPRLRAERRGASSGQNNQQRATGNGQRATGKGKGKGIAKAMQGLAKTRRARAKREARARGQSSQWRANNPRAKEKKAGLAGRLLACRRRTCTCPLPLPLPCSTGLCCQAGCVVLHVPLRLLFADVMQRVQRRA